MKWLTLSILLTLLGACSRSAAPFELEELDTEQLEELHTDTDAPTDFEKDTCFSWIYLNTCLPCFDCNACRHGSQEENERAGCYGSIAHIGECDGYFFYIPFEKDVRPECDGIICCEELPDAY